MKLRLMDQLQPIELFELLSKHGLVPVGFSDTVLLPYLKKLAESSAFSLIVDGEGDDALVLASGLSTPLDMHTLSFQWIPEVKRLHTRKVDLATLAVELRELWFTNGIRRVEARTTSSRTQTIRSLKNIGFRQETLDGGLRSAIDFGKGPEGVVILGMLESDAPRHIPDATGHKEEEATILSEEVAHG